MKNLLNSISKYAQDITIDGNPYLRYKTKYFFAREIAFFLSGIIGSIYFLVNVFNTKIIIPEITAINIFTAFVSIVFYFIISFSIIDMLRILFKPLIK